jgi:nitroimidazol reductase NimA-like FMN-containing flavoprotein (pyridoxamine 5'-phosphate oxidase superfamily)
MDDTTQVRLQKLTRTHCLELLRTAPVGRIGVSIGPLPAVLPVNFVLLDGRIVFRTIPGTKLDAAAANVVVAFEVDSYAADGSSGWSVVVQGMCSEITDPADLAALAEVPLRSWAYGADTANRWARIETTFISGRRFSHQPTRVHGL